MIHHIVLRAVPPTGERPFLFSPSRRYGRVSEEGNRSKLSLDVAQDRECIERLPATQRIRRINGCPSNRLWRKAHFDDSEGNV
jgi:hypothetical protein